MIPNVARYIVDIALAVILVPISNWLTSRAAVFGYESTSGFSERWQAPAFNWVYRILSPSVYTVLLAVLFRSLKLESLNEEIYFVVVFYVSIRILIYFIFRRARLVNWPREIILAAVTIYISYWTYTKLISNGKTLFPDWDTFGNEIWLFIIMFVYGALNEKKNTSINDRKAETRKEEYWKRSVSRLQLKYDDIVSSSVKDIRLKSIVYAIMVLETFNRPSAFRALERVSVLLGVERTQGVMQVRNKKIISDRQSVMQGISKLTSSWTQIYRRKNSENKRLKKSHRDTQDGVAASALREVVHEYNPDYTYTYDVLECSKFIRTSIWGKDE